MAYETTSLFDSLAADDTERQVARRRALALAHTRVENRLGGFLRGAVTMEEFNARLAACQDDLNHHVAASCTEVGHDNPDPIAKALINHYARTRRWQPREVIGGPSPGGLYPADDDATLTEGGAFDQGFGAAGPQCPMCGGEGQHMGTLGSRDHFRCRNCGMDFSSDQGNQMYRDPGNDSGIAPERLAQDKEKKFDPSKMQDSDDGKGELEPHQDDEDAKDGKPKDASVKTACGDNCDCSNPNCKCGSDCKGDCCGAKYHKSHTAADGNADLDGPEPKMDKRLWTPQTVKDPQVDDGRWPTERKDVVVPIGPPNNEHDLKEIGEKFTEHETLPNNTGDAGFDTGGVDSGPHTDTWSGSGQVDPVTNSDLS